MDFSNELVETGRFESDCPDHLAESIKPWSVQFSQLSSGSFHSEVAFARLDEVLFYTHSWNQRVSVQAATPPGYLFLAMPLSLESETTYCGKRLNTNRLAFESGCTAVDFSTARDGNNLVLLVPRKLVIQYIGEDRCEKLQQAGHTLESSGRYRFAFMENLCRKLLAYQQASTLRMTEAECEAAVFNLMTHLAKCLSNEPVNPPNSETRSKRLYALKQALEFVNELQKPVPAREIARAAGVSQRTLEYAFKEQFNLSPKSFLNVLLLNRAREQLIHADPESTTVKQVAMQWGFTHQGRFSVGFKKHFGDAPSHVLARPGKLAPSSLLDVLG